MLFPRVLVLTSGTSPPFFELFSFLFVVRLKLSSGRVKCLTRGAESERRKQKLFELSVDHYRHLVVTKGLS